MVIPNLSWSHYVELIKVSRPEARQFYALEASKNNWNVRELRRQISSFLFDRLSKSKDKEALFQLANLCATYAKRD
jgi:predicted nuclease of restriction endonuclease-like (RecB) superfamily